MKKRGMSTIIVTIIMITLVLAAVGVVWVIVQNILEESADDISLGALKINLDIEKVKITDTGVEVKVKRNAGKANLVGINFIVSDGVDTQVFEETTTMGELATKTFTLSYTGFVKSVEIAPVLRSESGKEKIVDVVEKEVPTFGLEFSPGFSCNQILKDGDSNGDGVYWLKPGETKFKVYCDMTTDGGGWTGIVATYYPGGNSGVKEKAGNGGADAYGSVSDWITGTTGSPGGHFKLSDDVIRSIIGSSNKPDYLWDQIGYNNAYSAGNYEYSILNGYTAEWHFDQGMPNSETDVRFRSFRRSDNAVAGDWGYHPSSQQGCGKNAGNAAGAGINCWGGSLNPNVEASCDLDMGKTNWPHSFHWAMSNTNSDNYLYFCNGPQHTSSNRYKMRIYIRETS